jgi:hypothetical protein
VARKSEALPLVQQKITKEVENNFTNIFIGTIGEI